MKHFHNYHIWVQIQNVFDMFQASVVTNSLYKIWKESVMGSMQVHCSMIKRCQIRPKIIHKLPYFGTESKSAIRASSLHVTPSVYKVWRKFGSGTFEKSLQMEGWTQTDLFLKNSWVMINKCRITTHLIKSTMHIPKTRLYLFGQL